MYSRVAHVVGIITKKKAFEFKYLHWSIHLPIHSSNYFSSHSGKKPVIFNPSQESRTYTGASPRWTCLEHPQGELPWRHRDRALKQPQLAPANAKKRQHCSQLPPDVRALHSRLHVQPQLLTITFTINVLRIVDSNSRFWTPFDDTVGCWLSWHLVPLPNFTSSQPVARFSYYRANLKPIAVPCTWRKKKSLCQKLSSFVSTISGILARKSVVRMDRWVWDIGAEWGYIHRGQEKF